MSKREVIREEKKERKKLRTYDKKKNKRFEKEDHNDMILKDKMDRIDNLLYSFIGNNDYLKN